MRYGEHSSMKKTGLFILHQVYKWIYTKLYDISRKSRCFANGAELICHVRSMDWQLVGGWALPLWKMMEWKSMGRMTSHIWNGKKHVWNHHASLVAHGCWMDFHDFLISSRWWLSHPRWNKC
jgi:hypothetical protein